VHKLYDVTCWRKYFWRWIMNLEPKKMNFNFWYGGVLHVGFETLLLKGLRAALKAMQKESKRRCSRRTLTPDDLEEITIQLSLLNVIVEAASRQPFIKNMELEWAERQLKCEIPETDVIFCTTIDGGGRYKTRRCNYEIKTATRVNNDFFTALAFDQQIHSHAWTQRMNKQKIISRCVYCVFRKTTKRIKKSQSSDGFIREIKQDLKDRPNFYFGGDESRPTFPYIQTLGKHSVEQAGRTIIRYAKMLNQLYDTTRNNLLNPDYWPGNDRQCLSYGACPYLLLCRNLVKWKLYTRLYQQREMLYEEERKELQK